MIVIDDGLLEKYGRYYTHRFVKEHKPYVTDLSFYEFVKREIGKKDVTVNGRRNASRNPVSDS